MNVPGVMDKELEILRYMKTHGFGIFHRSNIFLRDIQYGIRDFYRDSFKIDIGSRKADEFARFFIQNLERKGFLTEGGPNTWILHAEEFLNPPKPEEPKAKKEGAAV